MAKKTPETDDFKVKIDQTPQLTLNTTDKIYLALARRSADIYNFVYALGTTVCHLVYFHY